MKRFLADFILCLLGIAVIGLFGCATPSPFEPNATDSSVVVKDCMTEDGRWYNCDGPIPPPAIPQDSVPWHNPCLDSIPPCSIIPEVPRD